jgi:predicted ATPase
MLTQITVSGYKSLQHSTVHLSPFTVIVGRNNTGKSNLFDALHLLSHLAQMPVASAFPPEHHRGDPIESFFSEQESSLHIECDFVLNDTPHPFYPDQPLSHPFLHYEVVVTFYDGLLRIQSENLKGRTRKETKPCPYISTGQDENGEWRVSVNRDAATAERTRHFRSPGARSVLTMIDDAELYPHVVALANELSAWRFFHFDPEALREPSPVMDILELGPSGRGLSGFYDTLEKKEPLLFKSAEHALHKRGIPEAQNIRVLDTGDRR